MRLALNAADAANQVDATVDLAREAATAGPRSAWFGQTFGADSPQLAAIVGREVPELRAGASAIPVFGRHPLPAAGQLAFYERIPSYARVIELSGARRAVDVSVIGDESALAAEVRRYRDAGATEVVFSGTELAGPASRRRAWAVLGELAG
ncbi:hypothetical protein [Streptomyces youssoufiensis]